MAKSAKKKAGMGIFTRILILALLAALGWQLYHLHTQVENAQAQQQLLTAQVQTRQQENDQLEQSVQDGGSQEEKEKIARDQLGLVSPGERVFYDISN